jgi:uncharacterized protein YjdB
MMDKFGKYAIAALMCLALGVASCSDSTAPEDAGPILLKIIGGDEQTGVVGEELPEPLVVKATNDRGRPLRRYLVNFVVTQGDGSVYAGAAMTNWRGIAQDYLTLGPEPGENIVEVRAVNSWTGKKQLFDTFTATGILEPVHTVEVTPESAELEIGGTETVELSVVLRDEDGNVLTGREVVWSSNDEDVATVVDGLVTAVGDGEATITATSEGKFDTAVITVTAPAPVHTVEVTPESAPLDLGGTNTVQLTVVLKDVDGQVLTGREVVWSSNDEDVATVVDGLVTAVDLGEATITATSEGKFDTAVITVGLGTIEGEDQYEDNDVWNQPADLGEIDVGQTRSFSANFHDGVDSNDFYLMEAVLSPGGTCVDGIELYALTVDLTDIPSGSDYDLYVKTTGNSLLVPASIEDPLNPGTNVSPSFSWNGSNNPERVEVLTVTGPCGLADAFEFLIEVRRYLGAGTNQPYLLSVNLENRH